MPQTKMNIFTENNFLNFDPKMVYRGPKGIALYSEDHKERSGL